MKSSVNEVFYELKEKLRFILKPEMSFYFISIIYGIGVSILTLAIPISVQSLVNTVNFGVLTQPLIVLSIILLSLLVFSGLLNAFQAYTIELFQRRFYARTSADIANKLVEADAYKLKQQNAMELVNRYFDVMTVQKSVTTLLMGGVSVILQTIVGLLLLAFYHPYFLVFDIVLLFFIWLVWSLFGKRATYTALMESTAKYKVAGWFEELARENAFFKKLSHKYQALQTSDTLIGEYLTKRKSHFRQVFMQTLFLLAIYALMSSLVLGLGGFLVIKKQLTLGQLVAAELVVTVILSNFSRSGKYLESLYDLFGAVDKLFQFYTLPTQTPNQEDQVPSTYALQLDHVSRQTDGNTFSFDYSFQPGNNYLIRVQSYSAKLVFLDLLQNYASPQKGRLKLGGVDYQNLSSDFLHSTFALVDQPVILQGTLEHNLTFGLHNISQAEVNEALEIVDLQQAISNFAKGLQEPLSPSGHPFWPSQLLRLELARTILTKPRFIFLTEAFELIERPRREKILDYLCQSPSTLLFFSNQDYKDQHFDAALILTQSGIENSNPINSGEES